MTRADNLPAARFWSTARRRRWSLLACLAVGVPAYASVASWSESHVFLINQSSSLPNWAFLVDRHSVPKRGDHVFFDPPPSMLLKRHFGRDPQPFGKIVYGVAGDRVERRGRLFLINGNPVALAKTKTMRGEKLQAGPTGTIPRGCYFVATPNKDSFDSRYAVIGWICRPRVIGVGEPIL
ncbi:S26 family signal peptidase [Sphingomonas solaris]|uniref:Type VI secretion protein n=1 Tax=Alterirhizorhabdus solaris TaxID=2529389 RepID=A0A558R5H0_9SPHN|nr:S26 family signal peptidase [Sphingomonas solaris]TVV74626.1 type VI secretion protein [Sphingomonas solaris]